LKKLTTLYFHGTDFTDINGVLKKFAATGSVRDLTFIGCSYNESPKIAALFPQLTRLMSDGLCDELDQILKLKRLKSLSLGCSFSESELKQIHNELQGCKVELNMEFCFPGEMQVSTPYGSIPIKDIEPGMIVNTLNRETGRLDTTNVLRVDRHAIKEYRILRINVSIQQDFAGLESYPLSVLLEVTPNHPLFLSDGRKVSADELQQGDGLIYSYNEVLYKASVSAITSETKETEVFNLVTSKQSYLVEGLLVSDKF
jgi:hypothetical protein